MFTFSAAVSVGLLYAVFLLVQNYFGPETRVHKIDCGMVEFHPDYPAEVKAACRQRRML